MNMIDFVVDEGVIVVYLNIVDLIFYKGIDCRFCISFIMMVYYFVFVDE